MVLVSDAFVGSPLPTGLILSLHWGDREFIRVA